MADNNKKFKDTKLGSWLSKKAPSILKVAGELLPDGGVLDMVADMIQASDELSMEDKKEARNQLRELYRLEVDDRNSARLREVEIKKAGGQDVMMTITGLTGLLSFMFIVYAVVYEPKVLDNDLFVHLMGMVEGVVISNIFAYYYGTSAQNRK